MTRIRAAFFMALFLVLAVATLTACPLGRGSKKTGEKCYTMNDCASLKCSTKCSPNSGPPCVDAGVCE